MSEEQTASSEINVFKRDNKIVGATHRECSLDPGFDEPSNDFFDLVSIHTMPNETKCYHCQRLLKEEPPYYWSKMSYEEVHEAMKQSK